VNFTQNGLVAALSTSDQRLLKSCCEATSLDAYRMLASPANDDASVYFLVGTSVALLRDAGTRGSTAIGLVGQEGAVGLQFGLGLGPSRYSSLVQTEGTAWKVSGEVLRRLLETRPSMLLAVAQYLWASTEEMGAFAAAIQNQPVVRRLATWILKSHGMGSTQELRLTHSHMASMLGVRRASISQAADQLRRSGLIDYARGRIQVIDRKRLEMISRATG